MLTAVFITGKLGKVEDNYRYVYVEKVPEPEYDGSSPEFDKFKVKMWSNLPGILHKMKSGAIVTIKGRLEEQNGETFVIAELIRGV